MIIPINLLSPIGSPAGGSQPIDTELILKRMAYDKLYCEVLESIKEFEGLRLKAYYCPAGYKTIGYGHLIRKHENFGDSITVEQADSLLEIDFEASIQTIINFLDYNRYDDANKLLALSHFVYNIGAGGFEKSTLLQLVRDDKSITYEIMKWIHYMSPDSTKVRSNQLIKMRSYEEKLFNKGIRV